MLYYVHAVCEQHHKSIFLTMSDFLFLQTGYLAPGAGVV